MLRSAGCASFPGVGTSYAGGFYYQGDNRFNVDSLVIPQPRQSALLGPGWPTVSGRNLSLQGFQPALVA